MSLSEEEKLRLYCHWDSHCEDVPFTNESELDSHLKQHFTDADPASMVSCHWDSCHERLTLDELMDHFKTSHLPGAVQPHYGEESCDSCILPLPSDPTQPFGHVKLYDDAGQDERIQKPILDSLPALGSMHHSALSQLAAASPASLGMSAAGQYQEPLTICPSDCELNHHHNYGHQYQLGPQLTSQHHHGQHDQSKHDHSHHHHDSELRAPDLTPDNPPDTPYPESTALGDDMAGPASAHRHHPSGCCTHHLHHNHREQGPVTCKWNVNGKLCGQIFATTSELNMHLEESHMTSRKNEYACCWEGCARCTKPFSQRQKLVRHLQVHARRHTCKCHVCGRLFCDENMLKQHMRTHSGERPFHCTVCSKAFSTHSALTVHMRVHTGERPLMCKFPGCGKRFAESSNLAKHMKTHMERAFECPTCNRKFTRRDQLQRHQKTHQPPPMHTPAQTPTSPPTPGTLIQAGGMYRPVDTSGLHA